MLGTPRPRSLLRVYFVQAREPQQAYEHRLKAWATVWHRRSACVVSDSGSLSLWLTYGHVKSFVTEVVKNALPSTPIATSPTG